MSEGLALSTSTIFFLSARDKRSMSEEDLLSSCEKIAKRFKEQYPKNKRIQNFKVNLPILRREYKRRYGEDITQKPLAPQ